MRRKQLFVLLLMIFILIPGNIANARKMAITSDSGDIVSVLDDVAVHEKTKGDIVVILGSIDVQADVDGDVVAVLGDVSVNAKIGGSVVSILGSLNLMENAGIGGDAVAIGKYERHPGAMVRGDEVNVASYIPQFDMHILFSARIILLVLYAVFTIIFGFFMIVLFREKTEDIILGAEQGMMRKFVLGLLAVFALTIISVLLFITLIIPLLYVFLLLWFSAAGCIYLGRVLSRSFINGSNLFLELLAGVLAVSAVHTVLVYSIPVHYFLIGNLLMLLFGFFIASAGAGLILSAKLRQKQAKNLE